MQEISDARGSTQPIRSRTGGSTFANPEGHKAWRLIDDAGCRGLTIGGAQVSEQHCNFLINTGDATAADIEGLGAERSEEHTSELQSLMHISYAVFCLKKKLQNTRQSNSTITIASTTLTYY